MAFCSVLRLEFATLSAPAPNTSDSDIREAIIKELGSPDASGDGKVIYISRRYDLNNDGHAEVLAWVPTPSYGGTSGYPLLIFSTEGKRLRLLSRIDQVWTPLIILGTSKYGWRDVVMQMGGGGEPFKYVVFRYKGETYSDQPQSLKPSTIRGRWLIGKDWQMSRFGPLRVKE